eukprot:359034-Chlamydomonas_euryale.AAC.1
MLLRFRRCNAGGGGGGGGGRTRLLSLRCSSMRRLHQAGQLQQPAPCLGCCLGRRPPHGRRQLTRSHTAERRRRHHDGGLSGRVAKRQRHSRLACGTQTDARTHTTVGASSLQCGHHGRSFLHGGGG